MSEQSLSPPTPLRAVEYALRVTFRALGLIMVLLALAFAFSGFFLVEEGTVALRTRFGRPIGGVVGPGGPYLAWPAPIDDVLRFPTVLQETTLDESFWWPDDMPVLVTREPGWEIALLTGDKNLVHARWSAAYRLPWEGTAGGDDSVMLFARHVGNLERADQMVRRALEQGVIHTLAKTSIDDFYRAEIVLDDVRATAQRALDAMQSGIELVSVALTDRSVPRGVGRDFEAVSRAESEKARRIERAEQQRTALLNDVAGMDHTPLLEALDAYEQQRRPGADDLAAQARERIHQLLLAPDLGGQAAGIVQEALSYRARTVETARGASQRFLAMIELYEQQPVFYRDRQIQDAIERIFRGRIESFHLPRDERKVLYLEVGRN